MLVCSSVVAVACSTGTWNPSGNTAACQSCSSPCYACSTSASTCTSCQTNYYLSGTSCKCAFALLSCTSSDVSVCRWNLFGHKQQSNVNLHAYSFRVVVSDLVFPACAATTCTTCFGSATFCTGCVSGFAIFTGTGAGTCTATCASGLYGDTVTRACQRTLVCLRLYVHSLNSVSVPISLLHMLVCTGVHRVC